MSAQKRLQNTTLVHRLEKAPEQFRFVQLIRLLEALARRQSSIAGTDRECRPLGGHHPASKEAIRAGGNPSLGFPATEIAKLTRSNYQWKISVNFMGLVGAMGTLPYHYTEAVQQQIKERNPALPHFLDLFVHRTLSLLYRASIKYRLPLAYEHQKRFQSRRSGIDDHTSAMLAILGLSHLSLVNNNHIPPEALIQFGGLLSHTSRTRAGLSQLIKRYFGVTVEVEGLIPSRQPILPETRTRLGTHDQRKHPTSVLGRSAILGTHSHQSQGTLRIRLGPLSAHEMSKFHPDSDTTKSLYQLVKIYTGPEYDAQYVLNVKASALPSQIRLGGDQPARLGWNTLMLAPNGTSFRQNDTVDIRLSTTAG